MKNIKIAGFILLASWLLCLVMLVTLPAHSATTECPFKAAFKAAAEKIAPNEKRFEVTGPELKAFLDAMNNAPPVQTYFKADEMLVLDKGEGHRPLALFLLGCRPTMLEFDRDKFMAWLNSAAGI